MLDVKPIFMTSTGKYVVVDWVGKPRRCHVTDCKDEDFKK